MSKENLSKLCIWIAGTSSGFQIKYLKLKCKNYQNKYLHYQKYLQKSWKQQQLYLKRTLYNSGTAVSTHVSAVWFIVINKSQLRKAWFKMNKMVVKLWGTEGTDTERVSHVLCVHYTYTL